jgi:hypothetical protein
LVILKASSCKLGPPDLLLLSSVLLNNISLGELELAHNHLCGLRWSGTFWSGKYDASGIRALAYALQRRNRSRNSGLTSLNLSDNCLVGRLSGSFGPLEHDALVCVVAMLRDNSTLNHLNLSANQLASCGTIDNSTLIISVHFRLDLHRKEGWVTSAAQVAAALPQKTVITSLQQKFNSMHATEPHLFSHCSVRSIQLVLIYSQATHTRWKKHYLYNIALSKRLRLCGLYFHPGPSLLVHAGY